jgi:3-oxoacyl-[acyl-carrier protein] reductase
MNLISRQRGGHVLLEKRVAVIYGAGGAIGGAVARAFAHEGASVFLTGRKRETIDRVANEIRSAGGNAETAELDAQNEHAVESHLADVVGTTGSVDVSFNAVGFQEIQGIPLVDLSVADFVLPIDGWARTLFVTARAAARLMREQGSGVVLTINAPGGNEALSGGFAAASAAVGALSRTLASELGPHGVRVVCLQPNGIPESEAFRRSAAQHADAGGVSLETFLASMEQETLLHRLPTLEEVGRVAAFMASDRAGAMTGTVVKINCGSLVEMGQ